MHFFAGGLSLLIGICGWYYLFYSPAARRLGEIEGTDINRRRSRFRRINGLLLLLVAGLFYAGFFGVNPDTSPKMFVAVWLSVLVMLLAIVSLAVVDIRLTSRLKRR